MTNHCLDTVLQACERDQSLSLLVVAIRYNSDNIKAYYRKASALKVMRQYGRALQAAEQGRRQATSRRQEVSSEHAFFLRVTYDRLHCCQKIKKKTFLYCRKVVTSEMIYFQAFAGTKLYCLVTEAHRCEKLAQGQCAVVPRQDSNP